jgi:hypothetical protein
MEKEFIPYELAIALKKLGFDEPCIACYTQNAYGSTPKQKVQYWCNPMEGNLDPVFILAPLYQQAFRWFREKYGIVGYCYIPNESGYWGHSFEKKSKYDTYEEAELEFLVELIETAKKQIL